MATPSYVFPEELLRIPRDASAVIEASAGTGKTFLLEHLVVDRIVRGDARLEEILVVTFTEKATAELVTRVRSLLERVLAAAGPGDPDAPPERRWTLDAAAVRRLEEARQSFDRATITTIHGFCQRVLTENAFASRRLLVQEHVDSQRAFGDAFKEALRTTLSLDPRLVPYLRAWLSTGKGLERLQRAMHGARVQRRPWGVPYDEERLAAAVVSFAALSIDAVLKEQIKRQADGTVANTVERRAHCAQAVCRRFLEHDDPPTVLRELDEELEGCTDLFTYVETKLPLPLPEGPVARLRAAFLALGEAALPLELATAQLFLPVVEARLDARKRAAGQYDFDDMLLLIEEALRLPAGEALRQSLRQRYKLAIIDEFQDTDAVQWEIFRSIFRESGGRSPLYVIGDPKQAIYGFRGADVLTYQAARQELCGGETPTLTLGRNFRSTRGVLDATNAIFDADASEPFFLDRELYRDPVTQGRTPEASDVGGAPITLLAVQPREGADVARLRLRHVRQTLTAAMADEIERLRAGGAPSPLREIFVLTRTRAEAEQAAATLRARGIPHVLYNQEGLYETVEARHVRDLLAAVDEPRARARRLRAWLTPFFGLSLGDLPACVPLPAGHPLEERLFAWHALAEQRDWTRLYDRIVDESGVVQRELHAGGSARRLTNYLHLFDLLRAEGTRTPVSLGELVRRLTALTERLTVPLPEEGNVQRSEGDRDAVQIMTMHKAKGLEADHVFVYGAFGEWRGQGLKAYAQDRQRLLFTGRPRLGQVKAALRDEIDREDQRLLYVALTRARQRLYLPYAGDSEIEKNAPPDEDYWRITGAYKHVHKRLRTLFGEDTPGRFEARRLVCPPEPDAAAGAWRPAVAAWRPTAADLALELPTADLAARRRRHAGIVLTSYSRIKAAHGGYQPPTEVLDEVTAAAAVEAPAPNPERLPGGALSGIFLHAVLEGIPLESLAGAPALESWAARPEIQTLFSAALRRHDRDPRHLPDAQRLVHGALTTPLPGIPGLAGVAAAARVAREVEFLFPFPPEAGGADAGFVKGYIDVLFEHEGRTYFGDWKSDLLPDWSAEAVTAHVTANYELQRRLYALALVKMLRISDAADYEARFGGAVYLFVRGLPGGLDVRRPGWSELQGWQAELGAQLGAPEPRS